jgi:hypothetical protein
MAYVPESFSEVPIVGADAVTGVLSVKEGIGRDRRYVPAFGILTPLTASLLPNATVRLCFEAGLNPVGVKVAATPARATVVRSSYNMMDTSQIEYFRNSSTSQMNGGKQIKRYNNCYAVQK